MSFMTYQPDVLFHQPVVDYCLSPQDLGGASYNAYPELLKAQNLEEAVAIGAFYRVVDLKASAGTLLDRSKYINGVEIDASDLQDKRRGTLELAEYLADRAQESGVVVGWHGLADVSNFVALGISPDTVPVVRSDTEKTEYAVRLEESLSVNAEKLIREMKAKGQSPDGQLVVEDDNLVIKRGDKAVRKVPLHGYRFNRSGTHDDIEPEFIPGMPSCEAFIGATVLEQVGMQPAVVRVIPYWMKDREIAARDMLRLAGYTDMPVISVVASAHGDIEKTLPWTKNLPAAIASIKPVLVERTAHRVSAQVTKRIHDQVSSRQRQMYEQYCRPELASNLPPSALSQFDLISARAHEFLSRTLPGATLYEAHKVQAAGTEKAYSDIRMLSEIFGRNYQGASLNYPRTKLRVSRHPGINTNNVIAIEADLAARPEEDAVIMDYSKLINLVGYFTYENLPDEVLAQIESAPSPGLEILDIFLKYPPRSAIVEARRMGPGIRWPDVDL